MNYNIQRLGEINPELYKKLKLYCYDINGCCKSYIMSWDRSLMNVCDILVCTIEYESSRTFSLCF